MEIEKLQEIIDKSNNIVFFGGAGVSTESGIPDFRSKDGLYHMKYKFPPEEILSHSFFMDNLDEFYRFYKDKMNSLNVLPNVSHKFLAKLEKAGKLRAVITQNIDGLHTKAGSKNVLELHGTIYKNHCMECGREYSAEYVFRYDGVPKCECGGIIKPDVVLYEEALDDFTVMQAINYIKQADTLIVAGTSLMVYPASGLVRYFRGKNLVIINKDTTDYDNMANLVIHEKLGDVFGRLKIK